MKKIIYLFFLLFVGVSYSQVDDPINTSEYTLTLQDKISSVTISTNKVSKSERKLILKTQTHLCNFQKGILIKFKNNEEINLLDHALVCNDLGQGNYELSGEIYLDDDLYEKINKYDILEFRLGSINIPVQYEGEENLPRLIAFINQNKF
jgi:hypothetical protein